MSSRPLFDHTAPCLTLCQCVPPTCCVTVTILRGDSHGHSVALARSPDTRWEPIDRCCHLSLNTVKWMTHCHYSIQRATQLSYWPCVVPALVRSTLAFASNFPQHTARLPPCAGRRTVRPPRCPLLSEPRPSVSLLHCRDAPRSFETSGTVDPPTQSHLRRPDISSNLAFCDSLLNFA